MKRLYADGLLAALAALAGYLYGAAEVNAVFSSFAFQVTFGIVAGLLSVGLIGGGIIQAIDRKRADEMKKRIRFSFDKDKTSITIEPK